MNDVPTDLVYRATTVGTPTGADYTLLGEKTGHGDAAWVQVTRAEMGEPPPWRPARRRPVVALIDSGVQPHPWLPVEDGQDFLVEAHGWEEVRPREVPELPAIVTGRGAQPNFGSHLGHATFIAGIIRRDAPDAQVLSLKVMDDLGRVNEENVVAALVWLATYHDTGGIIDVALLAFGRRIEHGDDTSDLAEETKKAIDDLAGRGVRVVISAGNGKSEAPVFPASYARSAAHPAASVTSIGAGLSGEFPESYSSRGDWVTDWRPGSDVVSLMPLTPTTLTTGSAGVGYARWSGTSFAAARRAAELAAQVETIV